MATQNVGKVIQIAGPAVDVEFTEGNLPPIYQALRVTSEGFKVPDPIDVVLEVQQHLGEGRVRTRGHAGHGRHGARHERASIWAARSPCPWAKKRWGA